MNRDNRTTQPAEAGEAWEADCRGVALVELALLLPLMVLIAFCGLLLSSTFSGIQVTKSFSRDLGIRAYRDCAVDNNGSTFQVQRPENCLRRIANEFRLNTQKILPGAEYAISVYTISMTVNAQGQTVERAERTAYYRTGGVSTRYSVADFDLANQSTAESRALVSFRKIVVSEAFVPTAEAPGSLYFLNDIVPISLDEVLYAATIL